MSNKLRLCFILVAALSTATYLGSLALPRKDNHIIGSDGLYYYAYLPSVILDGDLDFYNQYARYNADGAAKINLNARTRTGLLPNVMPVGAAILWSPFFLLAHGGALLLRIIGMPVILNGYGLLYEGTVCLGNVIYGIAGMWLIWQLLRHRVDDISALVATVGTWLATNVLYYMVVEPSMSHTLSLFAVALFLYYRDCTRSERSRLQWAILGIIAGLMTLVRYQDVLFSLIVLPELIVGKYSWKQVSVNVGIFALATFTIFAPQMFVWHTIYGAWLTIPQGEGFMRWTTPHILEVLFSSYHGLFLWHPFYLIGLAGLLTKLLCSKGERINTISLLIAFTAQIYINAVVSDWYAGDSFGLRRFISSAPVLAIGAAELLAMLAAHARSVWPGLTIIGFLTVWNFAFMVQYRFGFIPMSAPLTFDQLVTDKFRLPLLLLKRLTLLSAKLGF